MNKLTSMPIESRTFLSSSRWASPCVEKSCIVADTTSSEPQGNFSQPSVRVQLLALVIFIRHAWSHLHAKAVVRLPTAPYGDMIDEIVSALLHLSSAHAQNKVRLDGVPEAAQAALAAGLTVISVDRFMSAIQPVATSDNEMVRSFGIHPTSVSLVPLALCNGHEAVF
jgi:hypothetical protein